MNPNNPRGQTPEDSTKKKPFVGDQMGQKAQRKDDKRDVSDRDLEKTKSNDMQKDQMADRGRDERKH